MSLSGAPLEMILKYTLHPVHFNGLEATVPGIQGFSNHLSKRINLIGIHHSLKDDIGAAAYPEYPVLLPNGYTVC